MGDAGYELTTTQLRGVLHEVQPAVVGLDREGNVTFVSEGVRGLLGFEPDEMTGRNLVDLLHPDDLAFTLASIVRWAGRAGSITGPNVRLATSRNEWVECTVDAAMGDRVAPLGTMVAILEARTAETDLRQQLRQRVFNQDRIARLARYFIDREAAGFDEALHRALVELSSLEYVTRLVVWRTLDADGASEHGRGILIPQASWVSEVDPPSLPIPRQLTIENSALLATLAGLEEVAWGDLPSVDDRYAIERDYFMRAGVTAFFAHPIAADGVFRGAMTFETTVDIGETIELDAGAVTTLRSAAGIFAEAMALREARAAIEFRAAHDPVTGLPNRSAFLELVAARDDAVLAVIDIEGFKLVNDVLGHSAGDELLRHVGRRLSASPWPGEIVARLGGDEFAMLLDAPLATAAARVGELVSGLGGRVGIEGHDLFVGVAAAVIDAAGDDPALAVAIAEEALEGFHPSDKRHVLVCDAPLRATIQRRHEIERELPGALRNGEFELYYQPEVDLDTRSVIGVEALLRWHHPTRGFLPAGLFVPDAERAPGFLEVGAWVVEQACHQLADWTASDLDRMTVRVNLSANQVTQPDLVDLVAAALERSGADPAHLCMELTESTLFADPEAARVNLDGLRKLGLDIAIDDFGTGYWSLRSLTELPVTILKLDRILVVGLDDPDTAEDAAEVAAAVFALAAGMGLEVVAEGVETDGQLAVLRSLGCQRAQGFLFSHPLPAPVLVEQLRTGTISVP